MKQSSEEYNRTFISLYMKRRSTELGSRRRWHLKGLLTLIIVLLVLSGCVQQEPWELAREMGDARENHTATLINGGYVLHTGGSGVGNFYMDSAEVYDIDTELWSYTDFLNEARTQHSANLLLDATVLVAGGNVGYDSQTNNSIATTTAEIYDRETDTWSMTGSMNTPRMEHNAVRLDDGRVLVIGGRDSDNNVLSSTELYDPATGQWSMTGSMNASITRRFPEVTLLKNGKVLVTGGFYVDMTGTYSLNSAELFDPATGQWSMTGNLTTPRASHSATVMSNGLVLIVGGDYLDPNFTDRLDNFELYDPSTGMFTFVPGVMAYERAGHEAIALPNGGVQIIGGIDCCSGLAQTEIYDPFEEEWSLVGDLTLGVAYNHTAMMTHDMDLLVTGGSDANFQTSDKTERFDLGLRVGFRQALERLEQARGGLNLFEEFMLSFLSMVDDPDIYDAWYDVHKPEFQRIMRDDVFLFYEGLDVIEAFYPLGESIMLGDDTAVITAEQMDALDTFFDKVKAAGSDDFKDGLAQQGDRLPPYDDFVGKTVSEATDILIGSSSDKLSLSAATYSVSESTGSVKLTVELEQTAITTVTVEYATSSQTATAGSDYTATSGTLTIFPGEKAQSVTVPIVVDNVSESAETFLFTLSNPVNASLANPLTATITINEEFKIFLPLLIR